MCLILLQILLAPTTPVFPFVIFPLFLGSVTSGEEEEEEEEEEEAGAKKDRRRLERHADGSVALFQKF